MEKHITEVLTGWHPSSWKAAAWVWILFFFWQGSFIWCLHAFLLWMNKLFFSGRKCDVLNRGFSGYTSAYNKLILPRILQSDNSPEGSIVAATVLLGSNDSVLDPRGITVEQYIANITDIINEFINGGIPASRIVLLTPPPVSIDMYTKYCQEQGKWTLNNLLHVTSTKDFLFSVQDRKKNS